MQFTGRMRDQAISHMNSPTCVATTVHMASILGRPVNANSPYWIAPATAAPKPAITTAGHQQIDCVVDDGLGIR
jgi:hypothetical protein